MPSLDPKIILSILVPVKNVPKIVNHVPMLENVPPVNLDQRKKVTNVPNVQLNSVKNVKVTPPNVILIVVGNIIITILMPINVNHVPHGVPHVLVLHPN